MSAITLKYFCIFLCLWNVTSALTKSDSIIPKDLKEVGRSLVEQGRTLVHHAFKRFMIILPAIFFKLGVAFTLLVLVTLVAVNNGFIGFLLLVVGMSSVLARLQETRRPVAVPFVNPLPPYHAHYINRKDSSIEEAPPSARPTYESNHAYSPVVGAFSAYKYTN